MGNAPDEIDPAKASIKAKKLSRRGRAFLFQRVIAGDSNKEILAALRARGFLAHDDQLSSRMFSYYRAKPASRIEFDRLTEQGRQAALRELSEGMESLSTLAQAARHQLREAAVESGALSAKEIVRLIEVQMQATRLAAHATGRSG